jgi:signal transduction histidine kinase/DNA-binding NarL/FixJ family response regulator
MIRFFQGRHPAGFSLSRILMVSLLVFALVPAGVVAWLMARSNVQALDDLGGKIVMDVARRVQIDTENHLQQAHTILNGIVAAAPGTAQNAQALAWLAQPESFEGPALSLTRQSPDVSYLFMANAHGDFFGVESIPLGVRIGIRGPKDIGRRFFLANGIGDRGTALPPEANNFEPRTRPWYKKAEEAGKRTFSPIYTSSSKQQLMISLVQPVYADGHALAGVFTADLYLRHLSDMLAAQSISAQGVAYLLDEHGFLVATSMAGDVSYKVNVDLLERVTPEQSKNAVIRASYAGLQQDIRRKIAAPAVVRGADTVQRLPEAHASTGLGALIAVQRPFGDELGLRWTLVVAAPEADFTGELRRALVVSLSIMAALVGLSALVAYAIARRVGGQLRQLGVAAETLGRGEIPLVSQSTRFSEVRQLSSVMHDSAEQLQAYRGQLQAHAQNLEIANETLEQRVAQRTSELHASREEALAAARVKAAFLAAMSHEIRTPVNGVLGMSALLADTQLLPEQRDFLQTIRVSGEQLLTVINDILDFSRIESGKVELESEPLGLRGALEQAVAIAGFKAREKGIAIQVDIGPGVPAAVRGDITRLRQVLINLVGNAAKFTDAGSITVGVALQDAAHCPLEGGSDGLAALRFEVRDTGIGIAPERSGALFKAFVQADASTTRKYGGTGLGLAICKRLVHLMGGEIGVDSVPGAGSCFWFTLTAPLATEAVPVDALPAVTVAQRGLKVLVADDNPVNRKVAAAMLTRLGYTVQLATNGREAVDAVSLALLHPVAGEHPLVAVLMDVNMPELDGLQATRCLIDQHGALAPPVIAMTASVLDQDQASCAAAGMAGRVLKPLMLADLARELGRCTQASAGVAAGSASPAPDRPAGTEEGGEDAKQAGREEAPPARFVDPGRLEEFRRFDDDALSMTRGVLRMYLKDAPLRLAAMRQALGAADANALYLAVHALKGSAGNIGASALEELCRVLESPLYGAGIPDDAAVQIAAIERCTRHTGLALEQLLERMPA